MLLTPGTIRLQNCRCFLYWSFPISSCFHALLLSPNHSPLILSPILQSSVLNLQKVPWWEGEWVVESTNNCKNNIGRTSKVVHVNWLQNCYTPSKTTSQIQSPQTNTAPPQWSPPTIDHIIVRDATPITSRQYPQHRCNAPDRFEH